MQKITSCFRRNQQDDGILHSQELKFGKNVEEFNRKLRASNKTRTSKYTWLSFIPLSLLYQFTRVANIYFLIISILTAMPFSPKSPGSMIGTFAAVLVFTMAKELFEDIFRMKSDREVNNTKTHVLDRESHKFKE
jgi:magnesium-transporting ATPase (P-type)